MVKGLVPASLRSAMMAKRINWKREDQRYCKLVKQWKLRKLNRIVRKEVQQEVVNG